MPGHEPNHLVVERRSFHPWDRSTGPSCDPKGEKKDEKKNPSAERQCDGGGPKTDKKDEKKNPSVADAECGGPGPKSDGKGDKKNPSLG